MHRIRCLSKLMSESIARASLTILLIALLYSPLTSSRAFAPTTDHSLAGGDIYLTNSSQSVSNLSETAWPNPPFRLSLSPGPSYLEFNNLGSFGSNNQNAIFHSLIARLLICLQANWRYPAANIVVAIPDSEAMNLASFYFEIRLQPKSSSFVPYDHLGLVLRTVSSAVVEHGLRELSAQVIGDPLVRGGLGMDLEAPLPIPRDVFPLFVAVPLAPGLLLELVHIGAPYMVEDTEPIFRIVENARDEVARRPSGTAFTEVRMSAQEGLATFSFRMSGPPFVARPPFGFSNILAASAMDALFSFLVDFPPCDLSFRVMQVAGQKRGYVGWGKLVQDGLDSNSTLQNVQRAGNYSVSDVAVA